MKSDLQKLGKSFGIILFAAMFTVISSLPVSADTENPRLDEFAHVGNRFYNPEDGATCVIETKPSGESMVLIGDSIANSVRKSIDDAFPGIESGKKEYDGTTYTLVKDSKSALGDHSDNHSGMTIAKKMVENNDMRDYLIFALGTNDPGKFTEGKIKDLVEVVGDNTKILLITNFGTKEQSKFNKNNKAMKAMAEENDNIGVADWAAVASSDSDNYISDPEVRGVHLTKAGKEEYMKTLKEAVVSSFGAKAKTTESGDNTAGSNKNYAGDTVWSDSELEKIQNNRSVYEAAETKYGIPWQAIAVMHSLEHSLAVSNPDNGQGIYQLYTYTDGGKNSKAFLPAGPVTQEEFARQTDIAVSIMKGKIESGGYDPASDEGIKYLLFSYNGMAKQYIEKAKAMGFSDQEANVGEGSVYVMNRYDKERDPAHPKTMDPKWKGRFVGDGKYDPSSTTTVFGGFVKYIALGGGGGISNDNCGGGPTSGDLSGYVMMYAWPEYHPAVYTERKEDYAKAVATRHSAGKWVGGSVNGVAGIDCGGFVTTLLNESGFDPDYNYGGVITKGATAINDGQLKYIREHSDQWKMVNPSYGQAISNESDLSPGDVAFNYCNSQWSCEHTFVYVGEIKGFGSHIASASYGDGVSYGRAPMAGQEPIVSNGVTWYHKVK